MDPTTVDTQHPPESTSQIPGLKKKSGGGWLFLSMFLLLLLSAGAMGAFIYLRYLPEREAALQASAALAAAEKRVNELQGRLGQAEKGLDSTRAERDRLDQERAQALDEKNKALSELERLRAELANSLEGELARGDVGIQQRGDQLVVDVADKILFQLGEAEVSEGGRDVLSRVAAALVKRNDNIVQVRGHTDNLAITSPKTLERFPSNWELSTARATNVVRYLQDTGKIAGNRLMAAGFAQFRPVSSNKNEVGRRKNRRIEIVLLPVGSADAR